MALYVLICSHCIAARNGIARWGIQRADFRVTMRMCPSLPSGMGCLKMRLTALVQSPECLPGHIVISPSPMISHINRCSFCIPKNHCFHPVVNLSLHCSTSVCRWELHIEIEKRDARILFPDKLVLDLEEFCLLEHSVTWVPTYNLKWYSSGTGYYHRIN